MRTQSNHNLRTQKKQVNPTVRSPRVQTHVDPACFTDHHAPRSVVTLFAVWVRQADMVDNGVISINLRQQSYSHTTTSAAIRWLVKHRLMVKIEAGGGRGVISRYFIRWSFTHPALSVRQKAVNCTKNQNTGNLTRSTREEGVLEESLKPLPPTGSKTIPGKVNPRLTDWLRSKKDGERLNERRDKLRLAVLIRRRSSPILGDCLCEVLFSRQGAAFEAWRWLLRMLWCGAEVPGELRHNRKRLVALCRVILELAGEDSTWPLFCQVVLSRAGEDGKWPTLTAALLEVMRLSERQLRQKQERNRHRAARHREKLDWYLGEVERTGHCPWCEKPVTQWEVQTEKHYCVKWFVRLEEELGRIGRRLREELLHLWEDRELPWIKSNRVLR